MADKNGVDIKRIFTFGLALVVVLSALYLSLDKCFERADLLFKDGSVEIKRPGSEKWIPLTEGVRIGRGCEIMTGEIGTVELELPGESFIKVGANSHVIINEVGMVEITKRAGNSVELIYGKARAVVAPFVNKRSDFSIKSEDVYVGVRGTDFGVIRFEDVETTQVLGLDGEVTVESEGVELAVKADEEAAIVEGEVPGTATKLDEDLKADFLREMDFISMRVRDWIRDDLKNYGTEAKEEVIKVEIPEPKEGSYTVVKGDNLWKISERFYGDGSGYTILYEANRGELKSPGLIYPGETILIPLLEDK